MNRYLAYQDGKLFFEDVALSEIAEEMYTPFYVYSKAAILEKVEALKQAFAEIKPLPAFNMKALDTTLILKILKERGCALAVENINEIRRAQNAGFELTNLILNSYGIPDRELSAIIKNKPLIINISHPFELQSINKIATELGIGVRIGLKINLGIEIGGIFGTGPTPHESHLGLRKDEIKLALALINKYSQLNLAGIACHLGSQITQLAPWVKMAEEMAKLFREITQEGFKLEYFDLGGGFPVEYGKGDFLEIKKIARNIIPHIKDLDCRVILEPGRYFTAESGVIVTSVLGTRDIGNKTLVICDAGFAEFPRFGISRISHEVVNVQQQEACKETPGEPLALSGESEPVELASNVAGMTSPDLSSTRFEPPTEMMGVPPIQPYQIGTTRPIGKPAIVDIVGPGPEGLEYIAKDVEICIPTRGSLLAILNTGAYARTFSSNFASHLCPPEILIERDKFEIIRERETFDDLTACDFTESELEI